MIQKLILIYLIHIIKKNIEENKLNGIGFNFDEKNENIIQKIIIFHLNQQKLLKMKNILIQILKKIKMILKQ